MPEKQITVSRVIDAPAERVFALLTEPERHLELDGVGNGAEMPDADVDHRRVSREQLAESLDKLADAVGRL